MLKMLGFILFVCLFLSAVSANMLIFRCDKKINFFVQGMYSYIGTMCLGGFYALVLSVINIKIDLISMEIGFAAITLFFLGYSFIKKKYQKYYLDIHDVLAVFVHVIIIGAISLIIFGYNININYSNPVDSGEHFRYAMNIVRTGKISGMYFNALYNALFIESISWIMPEAWVYKSFILSDIFHVILEAVFFYAVIVDVAGEKCKRWKAMICSIIYWLGFSLFAMMDAYIYWNMGCMLCQFVFVELKRFAEKTFETKWELVMLGIGCFAVSVCYIQLAPGVFITLFITILYNMYYNDVLHIDKKMIIWGGIILALTVFCASIGYYFIFASKHLSVFSALKIGDMSIKGLEVMIIFSIVIWPIYDKLKKRSMLSVFEIGLFCNMMIQIIMTIMASVNLMSDYYLYKTYIIIWFICIVLLISGRSYWKNKRKKYCGIYLCGILCFLALSYDSQDSGTFSLTHSIYLANADKFVNNRFGKGYMSSHDIVYLFNYAVNDLETDSPVPLLVTNDRKGAGSWYMGLYQQGIYQTKPQWEKNDIESYLNELNAEYFIVLFDDPLYCNQLGEYLDSFERVYVNEKGAVACYRK